MMKFETQDFGSEKQILMFPDHYVAFPQKFSKDSSLAKTVGSKKIIKAGTIYPSNDGNAQGVILSDLDVTDGDCNGAVVVHGFVSINKLPEAPTPAAVAAMPLIAFFPIKKTTIGTDEPTVDSKDYSKKVTVNIYGTDFTSAAETTTNWTLTDTDTTHVEISSVAKKDADTVEITFKTAASQTAAAGTIKIKANAAATVNGVASNELTLVVEA